MDSGKIARWLHRVPVSSRYFGPPRKYAETIGTVGPRSAREIALLKPQRITKNSIPEISEYPGIGKMIRDRCSSIEAPAYRAYSMRQGRVLGAAFGDGVITRNDEFLLDQFEDWGVPITNHPVHYAVKLPRSRFVPGISISLISRWNGNYWHWLFDCLGKLYFLPQLGLPLDSIRTCLVPDAQSHFKRDTLEIFGLDETVVLNVCADDHYRCEELILLSGLPHVNPFPESEVVGFLRRTVCQKLALSQRGRPRRRIYVSRRKATVRRIENESELERELELLGFETVVLEDLSFCEQVETFWDASHIVAQHGAGLANILFCQADTKLLEIFEPGFINPCYALLSVKLTLAYQMLINGDPSDAELAFQWKGAAEVRVNVRSVMAAVEELVA